MGGEPGSDAQRLTARSRALPPAGMLLFLLLAVTAIGTVVAARAADRDRRASIERRALAVTDAIGQRLAANSEIVYGIRGLFESRRRVTRAAFAQYVRSLEVPARLPGIQAVSFADAVDEFERRDYEAAVRRDARSSGEPYPARFAIRPPSDRSRHVVISYLEPVSGNERVFGLDLLSEPLRRVAVEATQQTGQLVATPPVQLVQAQQDRTGVLLILGVRNASGSLTDPSNGRFKGVVTGAVRVRDFMASVLRGAPGARLDVYDNGLVGNADPAARTAAARIFSNTGRAAGQPLSGAARTTLTIGGRRWAIYYEAAPGLISSGSARVPWLVAIAGLLLSLLAAALVHAIATRRGRAEELAAAMTADLRASRADLERSNEELERFAYVASHDLQEPLRTVTGFLGLLERRHGAELAQDAHTYVQTAANAADRGTQLIGDLLEYSRAAWRPGGEAAADLEVAWDRAVELLQTHITSASAHVTRGALPTVALPEAHMVRVFANLISNALKYRSADDPVIRATADPGRGIARIRVTDNGQGIRPAHHERIFNLFERLHTRDEYPGTGMGLAIVRRIVESAGGRVWVESAAGEGATFHLEIPAPLRATAQRS